MTQEEKKLLLKDLCARLPYGVMCNIGLEYPLQLQRILVDRLDGILLDFYEDGNDYQVYLSEVKPYLRSMSSMTEEEKEELSHLLPKGWSVEIDKLNNFYFDINPSIFIEIDVFLNIINWFNAHHFDYRGLIPMGLAIAVTKENNPYEFETILF